jgi:hypothetical protein
VRAGYSPASPSHQCGDSHWDLGDASFWLLIGRSRLVGEKKEKINKKTKNPDLK